jgi:hypothetical protein
LVEWYSVPDPGPPPAQPLLGQQKQKIFLKMSVKASLSGKTTFRLRRRRGRGVSIEIGQEHAPLVVLIYFFPHLNMQKACPTTLKLIIKV